jgi:hypothetical protein
MKILDALDESEVVLNALINRLIEKQRQQNLCEEMAKEEQLCKAFYHHELGKFYDNQMCSFLC